MKILTSHLFVYGTLKTGQRNHRRFDGHEIKSIKKATAKGKLYNLGHAPGMKIGGGIVHGEVVEVRDLPRTLDMLDRFEGYIKEAPAFSVYIRKCIPVTVDGTIYWAWTYIYNNVVMSTELIPSGVWKDPPCHYSARWNREAFAKF